MQDETLVKRGEIGQFGFAAGWLTLASPIDRLRSSNCNSDTIDGLPDWVVVEKQEYDLPKEAIRQLYHCYKIWNNDTIESDSIDAQNNWLNCFFYFIIIKSDLILIILTSIESVDRAL